MPIFWLPERFPSWLAPMLMVFVVFLFLFLGYVKLCTNFVYKF